MDKLEVSREFMVELMHAMFEGARDYSYAPDACDWAHGQLAELLD